MPIECLSDIRYTFKINIIYVHIYIYIYIYINDIDFECISDI